MLDSNKFLGLTKKAAQNFAEMNNYIFRLIRIDNEPFFPYPDDIMHDRICVEIDAGKVTKAKIM
jgi:hypothetical protein